MMNFERTDCEPCGAGQYKPSPAQIVSSDAIGASVVASATMYHYEDSYNADQLIDGVDAANGWAYGGLASQGAPKSAVFTLVQPSGVHSLKVSSGNFLAVYHVTGFALYYTTDEDPILNPTVANPNPEWLPIRQIEFNQHMHHQGLIEDNRVYDQCYTTYEVTVVIRTRDYGADIRWSIDDGPLYGAGGIGGAYGDNTNVVVNIDLNDYSPGVGIAGGATQHTFHYYDAAAPLGGWNGGYFDLYAHDGTYLGGGASEVKLGVLSPGTNPVTYGFSLFSIDDDKYILPNCTGQIGVAFHAVTATGIRVDIIDTDTANKDALVNEITLFGNTDCFTCADGYRPGVVGGAICIGIDDGTGSPCTLNIDRSGCTILAGDCVYDPAPTVAKFDCEKCPDNEAGVQGICTMCADGKMVNALQVSCLDCPAGRAGLDGYCAPCVPGTQPNVDKTECVLCTKGTYSYFGTDCPTCPTGTEAAARPSCGPLQGQASSIYPEEKLCPAGGGDMTVFRFNHNIEAFQARCDLDGATDGMAICPAGCVFKDDEVFPATCTYDPPAAYGELGPTSGGFGIAEVCDLDGSTDDTDACLPGCSFTAAVHLHDATCTGSDDGAATPCALSGDTLACAVQGGDCVYVSLVPPVVEACTIVVGTVVEENTAATTCTLTAFVAADPAANPAVVGVVGGCSVATGSGSCPYVAPVAGTAATCTGADDGAATPCTISGDATALGSSCNVPPVKSFAGNCVFDEAVVETAALCTGTNDGVASCTGVNDGSPAARACRLNEARDACAVQGGDCVFTAGVSTQAPHPHLDSRGFL